VSPLRSEAPDPAPNKQEDSLPLGVLTSVVFANGTLTYSACPPSIVFAGTELPNSSPLEQRLACPLTQ
jgi:hypothetical protein